MKNRKWIAFLVGVLLIIALYLAQMSQINLSGDQDIVTLDELQNDEAASEWEPFYRVRATLIDGESARFSIPAGLRAREGEEMALTGAPVFFGNGCTREGDTVTVNRFYLLPSLGLAEACVIEPDIEMRWTVRVILEEPWILHRDDMIRAMARVEGRFRIDLSAPYDGVFFLDRARAEIVSETGAE